MINNSVDLSDCISTENSQACKSFAIWARDWCFGYQEWGHMVMHSLLLMQRDCLLPTVCIQTVLVALPGFSLKFGTLKNLPYPFFWVSYLDSIPQNFFTSPCTKQYPVCLHRVLWQLWHNASLKATESTGIGRVSLISSNLLPLVSKSSTFLFPYKQHDPSWYDVVMVPCFHGSPDDSHLWSVCYTNNPLLYVA